MSFHQLMISKSQSQQNLFSLLFALHLIDYTLLAWLKCIPTKYPPKVGRLCFSQNAAQRHLHASYAYPPMLVSRLLGKDRCMSLQGEWLVFESVDSMPKSLQLWRW